MKGLMRIHNAVQTEQAWRDWQTIFAYAVENGYGDVAKKLHPPYEAGWRTVDKRIAKLREAMRKDGQP